MIATDPSVRFVTFASRTLRRIDGPKFAIGTDRSDMLTVTAPADMLEADVAHAVGRHYGAICRWVDRGEAVDAWQPLVKEFIGGEGFLLKGRSARFRWDANHGPGASFARDGFGWWLVVDAALRGNSSATRQAVVDCYGLHATRMALVAAERFASRAGIDTPLEVRVRDRGRAWVSMRSRQQALTVEASWALAQFSLTTIDYLVARALTTRSDVRVGLETLVPCPWQPRRRFHEEARNVWAG